MTVRLDNLEPIDIRPIKRALISVYDKTGLEDLARGLAQAGVEIVSTGSTAKAIAAAGVNVTPVEEVTGFPECLEGRVKTLHPKIHAGILADQRKADHRQQLKDLDIKAFDLVVCNLYPFQETVRSGANFDECVEQIDIGGPSMVRAAAKNHPSVAVVVNPDHYANIVLDAQGEGTSLEDRRNLAAEAFTHTAMYDFAIAAWFIAQLDREDLEDEIDAMLLDLTGEDEDEADDLHDLFFKGLDEDLADPELQAAFADGADQGEDLEDLESGQDPNGLPDIAAYVFRHAASLRYGENPHQPAALYQDMLAECGCDADCECEDCAEECDCDDHHECHCGHDGTQQAGIASAVQLHGKEMSYNNYSDGDAAIRAAYDHEGPCVAIIKHANPCGIAVADTIEEAHLKAHACDPVSAYGGVIATNRPVTKALAEQIRPIFTEVVLAPGYEDGALEVLEHKKNLRVLKVLPPKRGALEFKQISGGLLVQKRDDVDAPGDDPKNWELVAGEAADTQTLADLEFAWRTIRAVRSNAVLLAKDLATVGVGMGQVNRVDSSKLAVERANTLGTRSTGDAAKDKQSHVDTAGGARAEDIVEEKPEERARGAVAASDAFFPFADGLQVLIDAGVKAVVQPGGSIRDNEVIEAAQAAGVTMYLTHTRHFCH